MTPNNTHTLWQFMFTTTDRNVLVCHSSRGKSQIWKIMEMYLCRRCFISVWALWKIKISLCLWEEREWGGEGLCVHGCVCRRNEDARVFFFFSFSLCYECVCGFSSVCVFVQKQDCDSHIVWNKNFQAKCDKRCKSRADVSLFRHLTVKSSQKYLFSLSLPPSLCLASSLLPPAPSSKPHCSLLWARTQQCKKTCWWPGCHKIKTKQLCSSTL